MSAGGQARLGAVIFAASSLCLPAEAGPPRSTPSIIIFGGGWGAEGTQASLEAHVLGLQRGLADRQSVTVLFGSGDSRTRDVQIPATEVSEASLLLGLIFDRSENIDVAYRATTLVGHGPASKRKLLEVLERTRADTAGTIVFGVGHGTPPGRDERSALELFGSDDKLRVDDLARRLDLNRRAGPIAFVLGHCHSGAFTELTYVGGDPKRKPALPARCVLAAVPADRQASGCTADVDDPEARAYVAMIPEALRRRDTDLDGNGRVSLAEADAHARIHDRTVDVPIASSEVFLEAALGERAASAATLSLDRILERARPRERRVLTELRPHATRDAVKRAIQDLQALDAEGEQLQSEIEPLREEWDRLRRALLDSVLLRFPELANPYHAESRRLLAGDAREVVAFLKPRRELLELDARDSEIQAKENERLELDRRAARLERWLGAVEHVGNEEIFRKGAAKRQVEAYERLLACESLEP